MSSLKVFIEPDRRYLKPHYWSDQANKKTPIKKSLPFLESFRGCYAHRVKHVTLLTTPRGSSFVIKTWCGANFGNQERKGQTYFTEEPTNNRPICATCEGRFIGAGMDGKRQINGRKVMYTPMDRGAL